jgi:hypothetical protein
MKAKKSDNYFPLTFLEIKKFIRDLSTPSHTPGTQTIGNAFVRHCRGELTESATWKILVNVLGATVAQRRKMDKECGVVYISHSSTDKA